MKDDTMHDAWTERLSEYLDEELSAAERAALEQHLAGCEACRAVLADLRAVTAIAGGAAPTPPARDLWPQIATRIGAASDVVPIATRRPRARVSFTLPQLAAAAGVLMAVSGGAMWFALGGVDPVAPVSSAAPEVRDATSPAVLAASERPSYESAIADLEQALAGSRSQLDTATVRVLERSLATIDRAIEEARSAVERDPANPYLHRHLDGAMRKKMDILRRAVTVRRAGT
jgi:anti-sigma factor RsiW